jgi:copper transport protein
VEHGVRRTHCSRPWIVAGLIGGFVVIMASPAGAHAIVKSTEPRIDEVVDTAPAEVVMEFNEPVEISFGSIRVFGTDGGRVDAGETEYLAGTPDAVRVALEPDLPRGTYTVAWRIVSADGHPISEGFVFHVGEPGQNPQGIIDQVLGGEARSGPLESGAAAVGRWFNLASLLLLAGSALFLILVWGRILVPSEEVQSGFAARWRGIVVTAWVVAVVSTIALYILQGSLAADLPLREAFSPDVLTEVAETRFGIVSLIRLGLLVGCALMWPAVRRSLDPRRSVGAAAVAVRPTSWQVAAGGVLVVALLATPGLAGHAGTTEPVALNVAADVLHMVAAAMWMGGLLLLIRGAFPATRDLTPDARARALAPVVARFSDLAVIAVAALVGSGVVRAWTEVRALRALVDSSYGIALLLKVATFLPILALGFINNRWTKPRIVRAVAEGDPADAGGPLRRLRRLVGVEITLGAVVIAVTALLVNLPPARIAAGVEGPFNTEAALGHRGIHIMVDPNRVGENEIHITPEMMGEEEAHFEEIRVLFRMPEEGIGPIPAEATPSGHGECVVRGHQLSVPGEWILEIVARTGEFDEERTRVHVTVNP